MYVKKFFITTIPSVNDWL